jgi:hypothetical protein
MSLRLMSFGFAATTLLVAGAPVFAQNTGVSQNNFQGNTTVGNGNTSVNESKQLYSIQGKKRVGDTAVIQGNGQMNETLGSGNVNINTNSQKLIERYRK